MKTKKNTLILTICLITLSSMLLGCSNNENTKEDEYEKVPMSASWSYNYGSVEELSKASDLIAIIKIKDTKSDDTYSSLNVMQTVYSAEIEQLIYGTDQKTIDVVMTGGIDDNAKKIYEVCDDPLMKKNDEFLIFAQQNENGTYTILSGPQGRFEINDGNVYSLNVSNNQVKANNNGSNIKVDGEKEEEFIKKVAQYKKG